jgi:hypothetical protein
MDVTLKVQTTDSVLKEFTTVLVLLPDDTRAEGHSAFLFQQTGRKKLSESRNIYNFCLYTTEDPII